MPITLSTQNSYPLNQTKTFPLGEEIKLEFDNLVDDKSAKESIFLLKASDKSVIETEIKTYAIDANGDVLDDTFLESVITQKTIVSVKPVVFLEANTDYQLFIRGSAIEQLVELSEELNSNTLSARTVFNTSLDNAFTNQVRVYGSYEGESATHLNLEIVQAGSDSEARYLWWFENEARPQPTGNRYNRTLTRWRSLSRGCYIKFYGGEFEAGKIYQVKVYPKDKLAASYLINFSTSSDDLILKPEVESTSDIGLVLPEHTVSSFQENLRVISMTPENGSVNQSKNINKIVITFNKDIDPTSVTQDSIKLFKQPVSGFYNGESSVEKIPKEIIVNANQITLEF